MTEAELTQLRKDVAALHDDVRRLTVLLQEQRDNLHELFDMLGLAVPRRDD